MSLADQSNSPWSGTQFQRHVGYDEIRNLLIRRDDRVALVIGEFKAQRALIFQNISNIERDKGLVLDYQHVAQK